MRREEPRAGGGAEARSAESVFWVEKTPGVASGVARGKTADDHGHYEGDKDSVVVAGFAVISCCFCFVGTPSGVLQTIHLGPPTIVRVNTWYCNLHSSYIWRIAAARDWLRRGKPRWNPPSPTRDSKEA